MKNPEKVLLPSSNPVLVGFGEGESVERVPFSLLNGLPLDFCQSSTIGINCKWITLRAHCRSDSRSQLSNRIEDRLIELI